MCLPSVSCTPAPASTRRLRGAVPLAWKGTKCKASARPREIRFSAEANGGSQFPFSISGVIFIQLLLFLLFSNSFGDLATARPRGGCSERFPASQLDETPSTGDL